MMPAAGTLDHAIEGHLTARLLENRVWGDPFTRANWLSDLRRVSVMGEPQGFCSGFGRLFSSIFT